MDKKKGLIIGGIALVAVIAVIVVLVVVKPFKKDFKSAAESYGYTVTEDSTTSYGENYKALSAKKGDAEIAYVECPGDSEAKSIFGIFSLSASIGETQDGVDVKKTDSTIEMSGEGKYLYTSCKGKTCIVATGKESDKDEIKKLASDCGF